MNAKLKNIKRFLTVVALLLLLISAPAIALFRPPAVTQAATDSATIAATTPFRWRGASAHGDISKESIYSPTNFAFDVSYTGISYSSSWGAGARRTLPAVASELKLDMEITELSENTEIYFYAMRSDSFSTFPTAGQGTIGRMVFYKFYRGAGTGGFATNKLYFNAGNGGHFSPAAPHKNNENYIADRYNFLSEPLEFDYSANTAISLHAKRDGVNYRVYLSVNGAEPVLAITLTYETICAVYAVDGESFPSMNTELGFGVFSLKGNQEKTLFNVTALDDPKSLEYKQKVKHVYEALDNVDYVCSTNPEELDVDDFYSFVHDRTVLATDSSLLLGNDKYWVDKKVAEYASFNVADLFEKVIEQTILQIEDALETGIASAEDFNAAAALLQKIDLSSKFGDYVILPPNKQESIKISLNELRERLLTGGAGIPGAVMGYTQKHINVFNAYIAENVADIDINTAAVLKTAQDLHGNISFAGLSATEANQAKEQIMPALTDLNSAVSRFFAYNLNEAEKLTDSDLKSLNNLSRIKELETAKISLGLSDGAMVSRITALSEKIKDLKLSAFSLYGSDYSNNSVAGEHRDYALNNNSGVEFRLKRSDSSGARLVYNNKISLESFNMRLVIDYLPMMSDLYNDGTFRNKCEILINFSDYPAGYLGVENFTPDGVTQFGGIALGLAPVVTGGYIVNLYIGGSLAESVLTEREDTPHTLNISAAASDGKIILSVNDLELELDQADCEGAEYLSIGNSMNSFHYDGTVMRITEINGNSLAYAAPEPPVKPEPEKPDDYTLLIVLLSVGAVVLAAGAVAVVFVVRKRNKNHGK